MSIIIYNIPVNQEWIGLCGNVVYIIYVQCTLRNFHYDLAEIDGGFKAEFGERTFINIFKNVCTISFVNIVFYTMNYDK